jgi:hypothetical protein
MSDVARPQILCLCGSTRFMSAFQTANRDETLAGRIVLSVGVDLNTDTDALAGKSDAEAKALKSELDRLHLHKIDLADEILVINVGGYIGPSTKREIEYATKAGKRVRYLEPTNAAK